MGGNASSHEGSVDKKKEKQRIAKQKKNKKHQNPVPSAELDGLIPSPQQESPSTISEQSRDDIFTALYTYNACSQMGDDLSFSKGDRLCVLDKSAGDWWKARHVITNEEGYIPSNYVTQMNNINNEGLIGLQTNVCLPTPETRQTPRTTKQDNNKGNIFVALYSYEANAISNDDLAFSKGDRLLILDKRDGDWLIARNLRTSEEGYVPSNFIAEEISMESKPWFFGDMTRKNAERKLKTPDNVLGTFLIREGQARKDTYSLSVLDGVFIEGYSVRHYSIETRGMFSIAGAKKSFPNLDELVRFYQEYQGGLCTRLSSPCRKVVPNIVPDQWEIPRSSLVLGEILGSGQFGEVYEGTWNNVAKVAVKTLKPGSMSPHAFLQEANIMKSLRHRNLLQLLAVCSSSEPIYIVTELVLNGSLITYLRDGDGRHAKLPDMVEMATQIAAGMAYLERENFIHRDLAARNILVGENCEYKVADFGLTRLINDEYIAQNDAKFPVKWTAPEAVRYKRFTIKSDVWSFGIVMYEIITKGMVPYPGMGGAEAYEYIECGNRMLKPKHCPDSAYQLMLQCWQEDPLDRPTFEFLHSYLDDYFVVIEPEYKEASDLL
ncbi:tyrosine-protein kinase STK-like [Glandiceps talaboti]